MGSAASATALPDFLSAEECANITGEYFDIDLFKSYQNEDKKIPKRTFLKLIARTDVFLTHDWGVVNGVDNHARVSKINAALQAKGLTTWFDSEQMEGNIKQKMTSGIDNAQCIIVFITGRYVEKVASDNAEDNCQLEFNYASMRKTASKMIPVVMEKGMRNTSEWEGAVGMVLGSRLYIDVAGDLDDPVYLEERATALYDYILRIIGKPVRSPGKQSSNDDGGRPAEGTEKQDSFRTPTETATPVADNATDKASALCETMAKWMEEHADIIPDQAAKYASLLMKDGVGNMGKAARKHKASPGYLEQLGFDAFDAGEIVEAMYKTSLLHATPAVVEATPVTQYSTAAQEEIVSKNAFPRGTDTDNRVNLQLSGAGCPQVNGVYIPHTDGTYSGCLYWINLDSGLKMWYNTEWRIGDTCDYYYCGDTNPDNYVTDWKLPTKHVNPKTCLPAPTIALHTANYIHDSMKLTDKQRTQLQAGLLPLGTDLSVPVALEVSNCGVDKCNGIYDRHPSGSYSGCLYWMNKATGLKIWYNSEWRLGDTNDYYYLGSTDKNDYLTRWRPATGRCVHPGTVGPRPVLHAYERPEPKTIGDLPVGTDTAARVAIVVSGAGTAKCNGIYAPHPSQTYNGCLYWKNPVSGIEIWYNGEWRMGNTNDYYYRGSTVKDNYVQDWVLSTGSGTNSAARDPAPSFHPVSESTVKLSRELDPQGTQTSATVFLYLTNAGSPAFNGVFAPHPDHSYKGCLYWINIQTGMKIWYNTEWRMGDTRDYYYLGSSDKNDYMSDWKVSSGSCANKNARDPVPTISVIRL